MIDKSFFEFLYQYCETGKINIRPLPGTNSFFDIQVLSDVDDICKGNSNFYFGVALRDNDGTKDGITEIPAVWSDIDFKDTPKEILREKLKRFPFKPSIIVKSGGGIHLYWVLKEPAVIFDVPVIEDINRRIAIVLGGDKNACDASRIMRVPGTLNIKYTPPIPCELIKKDNFFYDIETFLDILPEIERPKPIKINGEHWLADVMVGVSAGERNATATKIAGYWINKLSAQDTLEILKMWNKNNLPPLPDKDIEIIIKSISRYKKETKEETDLSNIYNVDRMVEAYEQHILSLKNNRFITGIGEIDKRIRGVAGGEVLTIIARAGSFKTASLQNMLKNYISHSSWAAAFFSIEMPVASLSERYFGLLDGCDGRSVEKMFTDKDMQQIKAVAIQDFKKDLKNLYIIPSKISVPDISRYIKIIEQAYSIKVGVIGIDYLGLLDAHGSSEYERMSEVAKEIKNTAKELNLPIVVLSQTSRKGGEGQTQISLDMGRGSGAIEEGADFVLGLWQIEEYEDIKLICKILKNRKGRPGSMWELDLHADTLFIGGEAVKYISSKKNAHSEL